MLCQRLPVNCKGEVHNFHRIAIKIWGEKKFLLSQIGNADQTARNFAMPRSTPVETEGTKSVHVRTIGAKKRRCTVMLAVTADGRKLPPFVIFKWKMLPKNTLPTGIHVCAQEKAWMLVELTVDWFQTG